MYVGMPVSGLAKASASQPAPDGSRAADRLAAAGH